MPLVPRNPLNENTNNKSKNRRGVEKPKPRALDLTPTIKEDEFAKRKADPPKKAYQGKTRRDDPKDKYRYPTAVGAPV